MTMALNDVGPCLFRVVGELNEILLVVAGAALTPDQLKILAATRCVFYRPLRKWLKYREL